MHDAGVRLPILLQPISLRGIFARNRIVVSPMCQYHSDSGGPTDWHLVSLGKYAIGGAGIVFTEETAVEERGRKTYECAGIYADCHVPAYRRITDFIRSLGAIPAIQLGHAGRKASSDLPWCSTGAGKSTGGQQVTFYVVARRDWPNRSGGHHHWNAGRRISQSGAEGSATLCRQPAATHWR